MRNAFYTNTLTLLHSLTPLTFSLLYNKDIIVNLYKLYFPSSHFSLQQNKKAFHPPTFPTLQPNTHERKPNTYDYFFLIFNKIKHVVIFVMW